MTDSINSIIPATNEIVLTERIVATEWKIVRVQEDIRDRWVRAEVELGPFVDEPGPGNTTISRGRGGIRNVMVWQNEDYDAIRDTWTNLDLIAKVKTLMA